MVSGTEIFDVWKDKKIAKETQYYVPSQVGFMPTPEGDLVADEKGVVWYTHSSQMRLDGPQCQAFLALVRPSTDLSSHRVG
jgi:hypothetical protein